MLWKISSTEGFKTSNINLKSQSWWISDLAFKNKDETQLALTDETNVRLKEQYNISVPEQNNNFLDDSEA